MQQAHRAMDAWLMENAITPLPAPMREENVTKAGLLPFIRRTQTEQWKLLLMRPRADKPALGPPLLQLCKGTRMQRFHGTWQDIKGDILPADSADPEPLSRTALREGLEELGLPVSGITRLFDAGTHAFTSASSSKPKYLRLFLAEVTEENGLLPAAGIAATTAERAWLSLQECTPERVRGDHIPLIRSAVETCATTLLS